MKLTFDALAIHIGVAYNSPICYFIENHMTTRSGFLVGILTGLTVATAVLVILIFAWRVVSEPVVVSPSQANSISPQTDIQVQVDALSQRIDKLENDQAFALRDLAWRIDQKLFYVAGMALVVTALAAFFGIRTYDDIVSTIRKKLDATIQQELYQLDPTNIPIHLQSGQGMEPIHRRLQLSGLKNISYYDRLDKRCLNGITIVAVPDEAARQRFRQFIEDYSPDPFKAAYILYAPPSSVDEETLGSYENLVTANFPATVVSMVLVVGRGLKPDP